MVMILEPDNFTSTMSLSGLRRPVCLIPKFALCIGRSLTVPICAKRRNVPKVMSVQKFSASVPKPKKETICLYFVDRDGDRITVNAGVGSNFLDVAIDNDIELEGACEGTLACSTCHLIFKPDQYDQIHEKPTDEELDMLDLAFGLSDTSRLGCQVIVTKEMDGWEIEVPSGVADARG
ncbi:2Fe-2S ferredoxin-like isoform X2 [Mytilus californianus]|uniref:2Fe-2S ferredoxin-like isoform X2 n=1 Tax=Mytilus californianus TaxID=6549 RepID=UPI0022473362|nr:2Fe-2S ferredoxin-like isoform X2 [Mytilus californianus]